VLKQKRGQSLDLTLQTSSELKNLGLSFCKFKVSSPLNSTNSSKAKKIILRQLDHPGGRRNGDEGDEKNNVTADTRPPLAVNNLIG